MVYGINPNPGRAMTHAKPLYTETPAELLEMFRAQIDKLEDTLADIAADKSVPNRPRLKAQITLCEVRGMERHFEPALQKFKNEMKEGPR
jgi:hypothetical protein